MPTVTIIVGIVCLLGVLVSYAFVQQTVQSKREQKKRLISALKARTRTFKFMLSGFPTGFLPKELTILVQRSLIAVSEQLSQLDPNDPEHMKNLQLTNGQLLETQKQIPSNSRPTLGNPQQIKDVRAALEELHKFVYSLEEKSLVPRAQAQVYRNQIKDLALQVSVDGHCLSGNQAGQAGKIKLAVHYFDLAEKLIVRESKTEAFKVQLKEIRDSITKFSGMMQEEHAQAPVSRQEQAEMEGVEDEWNKFGDKEDIWKKKNVYD